MFKDRHGTTHHNTPEQYKSSTSNSNTMAGFKLSSAADQHLQAMGVRNSARKSNLKQTANSRKS